MDRSEIRVFVVEDAKTLGKAIHELVKKMGFQPVLCPTPQEAEAQLRIQGGQLIIIDCLLPKTSGVDFAVKLRGEMGSDLPMILMSGIYKDKAFQKDALHKTGAVAFLAKPFNISELQEIITKHLEKHIDEVTPLELLLSSNPSPQEKIQHINALKQIEAFDIPWLCCGLMNNNASGVLSFNNDKEKSAIYFSNGKISQVEMQNPESFFGALLVENGYLTPEQLETALKAPSSKKLGERLVEMNLLSPHVINIINAEQTAIRLSRLITDAAYNVSFKEQSVEAGASYIDTESIAPFLIDWINSKIELPWIKQRYLKWLNSPSVKTNSTVTYQRLWNLAPLKNVPDLVNDFANGLSLSQVLAKAKYKEDVVYQVFHLLILIGFIHLKREIKQVDEGAQLARLQRIWQDMQTQDHFAVLGIKRNAKSADVKRTYYELAKIFHPDRVPASASAQLKDFTQKVFGRMTTAYEVLSDDQKRDSYLKEMDLGKAEKILQAENLVEEGKALLKSGQASKAREKFDAALQLRSATSEILIHMAWAKLMAGGQKEENLVDVEQTLNKIPPEDRHNALYYFVKGLFQKMIGDEAPAKKNIQHALALNPKFLEAERALRTFDKKGQKTDLFHADLGAVVGSLFKKK